MADDYEPPSNRPILRAFSWVFPLVLVIACSFAVQVVTPVIVAYVESHWIVDQRLTDLAVRGAFVVLAIPSTILAFILFRRRFNILP